METSTTEFGMLAQGRQGQAGHLSTTAFQVDRESNQFLATLAHELRNPLAPIMNGLHLLNLMEIGEKAEAIRAMMTRQVEQIVHLVDDLLDMARIGAGKLHLDKQICRLSTIVESAIEEASVLICENDMTLEVTDESQEACVCGDPNRLTQVVCNLLNNSARYGRPGGKIQLGLMVRKGSVVIRVQDDGIGIDADRLEDIFNMYCQIGSTRNGGSAGLGIGLALVRTVVELHGGLVSAESDGADCGSTFTVSLPLVTGIGLEKPRLGEPSFHSSGSFRVLVVDDLRAMRVVTQQLLEKLGYEVQVAEIGEDALEQLSSFRPDVVFADITMPVMGGHELARKIRARSDLTHVSLVALTGYGQSSDRELAFEAGFDHHLTKPVDFQRLKVLFDELDRSHRETLDSPQFESGGFHQTSTEVLSMFRPSTRA